jgi:hypothetical protein
VTNIETLHYLLHRETADCRVGARERSVFENGMVKQIRRDHRGANTKIVHQLAHLADATVALRG